MSSTPTASAPRLDHIPELDGVRGLAALMVLCHHLFFTSVPNPERWNWFVNAMSGLAHAGQYGVDLFFVLSGFLITSLLLQDRPTPGHPRPGFLPNFYWKRALRILPLYLIALLCLLAIEPASWRYCLLGLLFLANFAQPFHMASAGPFWTLAIEEQFYLLWPRFAQRLDLRRLERLALAIAIAGPILRLLDAAVGHSNFQLTFFRCDGLALGALLACRRFRRLSSPERLRHPEAPYRIAGPQFLHGSTGLAGLTLLAFALIAPTLRIFSASRYNHLADALQVSGATLLSFALVAGAVHHSGSRLLALLRSRLLTFFGLISYCLYLVNSYVVLAYDHLRGPMSTGNMRQYSVRAMVVAAIAIGLSVISRYAIELPAMRLRRLVLRPR